MSANGRFVAFDSAASNLVVSDLNKSWDVFVHDRQTHQTTRVSIASDGREANTDTRNQSERAPAISADGRYVAFRSSADNLVAADTNKSFDVFVHDRQTAQTTRVSLGSGGIEGDDHSSFFSDIAISADGRYVAFESGATNWIAPDTNGNDIYRHDRQTGTTLRISESSTGVQANQGCLGPAMSADGRYIAFRSYADNLVTGDTNTLQDVFVRDVQAGTTIRASIGQGGVEGNDDTTDDVAISGNGRVVAWVSGASNLVANDNNNRADVFVRDLDAGTTTRVSIDSAGVEANDFTAQPALSFDGRFVAFWSQASNLVSGDGNDWDVFVHDRSTGVTRLMSVGVGGAGAGGLVPTLSGDGFWIAFSSDSTNLVGDDSNLATDVFVTPGVPQLFSDGFEGP
ncbi:MAG: PD40 domain-containing protein [Xanthomonadales bacterium]|nr:PD40 domain-containing protein [Xanthomonadales bacterium]MBK7146029.1 PD40 domain-containing protein [Xanthomonadales bacterium]